MKALGLAHIVAVSGSHLSVVAALVSALLTRLGCSKRLLSLTLCFFYASYAVFTGLSAPVLRAAVMASVIVLSIWAKRRSHALSALGACVCVLIALHPENALSLSFFLSAASTFGVDRFLSFVLLLDGEAVLGACSCALRCFRSHVRGEPTHFAGNGGGLLPPSSSFSARQLDRRSGVHGVSYGRASCSRDTCGRARGGVGGACDSRVRGRCLLRRGGSGRAACLVFHSRCGGYARGRFCRRVRCGAFMGVVAGPECEGAALGSVLCSCRGCGVSGGNAVCGERRGGDARCGTGGCVFDTKRRSQLAGGHGKPGAEAALGACAARGFVS